MNEKIKHHYAIIQDLLKNPTTPSDLWEIILEQQKALSEFTDYCLKEADLMREKLRTLEMLGHSMVPRGGYEFQNTQYPLSREQLTTKLKAVEQFKDDSPILMDYYMTLCSALGYSDSVEFELERKPDIDLLLPLINKLKITNDGLI